MPAELLFLDQFYQTQTLSNKKLQDSSYTDPAQTTPSSAKRYNPLVSLRIYNP
jgi:hypothetical protein